MQQSSKSEKKALDEKAPSYATTSRLPLLMSPLLLLSSGEISFQNGYRALAVGGKGIKEVQEQPGEL